MDENNLIKLEGDKYYVAANSTYADDRVRVLNHADTFGIFDRWGDIQQIGTEIQGIYHEGTRFISWFDFKINGYRPLLLSSSIREDNEILSVDLTNPEIADGEGHIPRGTIHIARSKFIRNGVGYEKITLSNFNDKTYYIDIQFSIQADFKDIFEVRGIRRQSGGEVLATKVKDGDKVILSYRGLDNILRTSEIWFSPIPDTLEEGQVIYKLTLRPHEKFTLKYSILFQIGTNENVSVNYDKAIEQIKPELEWRTQKIADIHTSNEQFNHWINRSQADLISLLAKTPQGNYPYAGVPWYNTAFGRDGIITALEILWIAPEVAKDILLFLADTQAKKLEPFRDAEPGKIFHEKRGGEMVELGEIPFKLYYGTIDATPLFVVLAGEYFKRTGDINTIRSIWQNIEFALKWVWEYGDLDRDGFVEYQHKSENGLTNQGWKDSFDSVFYSNGKLAEPPIALCEVQGYVYLALKNAAMMASYLEKKEFSDDLQEKARKLKKKFNEVFWDSEIGSYILALDGNKNPCKVKSSNAGQCLFTGIVNKKYATTLVRTLMGKEMFSGWGIRTISTDSRRYNPMSYHNGSIWPHDVALIAFGFAKYGFRKECLQLMQGLFDATLFIDLQRLPELFCGFERRKGEGPTAYPVACSPQAWSVAAVFLLLQSCLQIEINSLKKKIYFYKPMLPEYLEKISVKNLQLGKNFCDLELQKYGNDVVLNVLKKPDNWQLIIVK